MKKINLKSRDFIKIPHYKGNVVLICVQDYLTDFVWVGFLKKLSEIARNKDNHVELNGNTYVSFKYHDITVSMMKIGSNTFAARYNIGNAILADGIYTNEHLCIKNIFSEKNIAGNGNLLKIAMLTSIIFWFHSDMANWIYNDEFNLKPGEDFHDYVMDCLGYTKKCMDTLYNLHEFEGTPRIL